MKNPKIQQKMIHISSLFIKAFRPAEQLIMLQLLLRADQNGIAEFSDRGMARATEIPYQQVRTIHQRWLADGTIINADTNAGTNANRVFVTISDYESYIAFNVFSNADANAVVNAHKDKEITTEKDKVSTYNLFPIEKENNKEKEGDEKEDACASKKRPAAFIRPTVDEVYAYITRMGYHIDAERFHAYYESNGWMVGRNKMKDWKAACRTWEVKTRENTPSLFEQTPVRPDEPRWE